MIEYYSIAKDICKVICRLISKKSTGIPLQSKVVDNNYKDKLQAELTAKNKGVSLRWCREDNISKYQERGLMIYYEMDIDKNVKYRLELRNGNILMAKYEK
jgi:hypothetical protein